MDFIKRYRTYLIIGGLLISGVLIFLMLKPRALEPSNSQAAKPYFSQADSFFARGNFINLDQETFTEEPTQQELSAPSQIWTVAGTNTVSLNWTRHPQADKYLVQYFETAQKNYQTAKIDTPFFTVRNAHPNTSYAFRVKTIAADGAESDYSPTMAVTSTSLKQSRTVTHFDFEVAGWLPPGWEDPDVRSSFERGTGTLTIINPFWYNFSSAGKLEPKGNARNPEIVARAHQANMRVIPTITNNYDPNRVSAFLNNKDLQQKLIKDVLAEIKTYNYDGIDLDWENVRAADKKQFTDFLITLSTKVRKAGKLIELTAQPKKSDGDNWDGPGALDLDALSTHFDRFKPMIYDYSRPDSEPGPISPLPWIKEVLTYWKTKVPADKILAGIPFYGYDWSLSTDDDVGIVWDGVQKIKEKFDVDELFDEKAGEPYLRYSEASGPRIVYYQDAKSVSRKVEIVKETGVAGIAIWLLGSEDPQNFNAISKFTSETKQVVEKPLNLGLRVKGRQVDVSVTRFPEIASVKVLYGSAPNQLTGSAQSQELGLINLPDLRDGETRYIVAVAYDKAGKELRRSGVAMVDASAE